MRETDNDAIMERVDQNRNLSGFFVLAVCCLSTKKPLIAELNKKLERMSAKVNRPDG